MISEIKVSKVECQNLKVDKEALKISTGNIERNAQATSAEFEKPQQKYQSLEAKKDHLQLSVEELNKEKRILEGK